MKKVINKKMSKICMKKQGFSIIEVLISLTIMTLGLAAISTLMASSIRNSNDAKNQMIAAGLAQEAIELVRNFKGNEPTFKSDPPAKADGEYRIDVTTTFAAFSNNPSSKQLYRLPENINAGGFYTHSQPVGSVATKFYRKVVINNDAANKQIRITSYVSWSPSAATEFPEGNDIDKCKVANKCVSIISVMQDE